MSKKLFSVSVYGLMLSAMLSAAGCVPAAEEVVATVDGEHEITASDVIYYYERSTEAGTIPAYRPLEDSVNGIVEAAVTGKILELEAEARGLADDPAIESQLSGFGSQTLVDMMFSSIADSVPVKPVEVLDYYEKSRKRRMYSFIETEDAPTAEAAYAALEAGTPWEEVVKEYSSFKAYTGEGGKWDAPMEYGVDADSKSLFALEEVGDYTGVVYNDDTIEWRIYRLDRLVHGDGRTYEEAAPDIEVFLQQKKTRERFQELAAGWRKSVPIKRNEELWQDIITGPAEVLWRDRVGKGLVISDVGGIPVKYDILWDLMNKYFGLPPSEIDAFRARTPDRYERIWDSHLRDFEALALAEYQARREGFDNTAAFRHAMASYRAATLIDALYRRELEASLPLPTDEEIVAFYEAHRDNFLAAEVVEVYVVAMPDRAELDAFYRKIKDGGDIVIDGEARNRAREKEMQEMYELPPNLPPEQTEWLGVVEVGRDPTRPNAPLETPLAAELRLRVFPFAGLGVLSEVFQLEDGRWAFYQPIYYKPGEQLGLDDPNVVYHCRKEVFAARVTSPETLAMTEEWMNTLKARHDVVLNEDAIGRVVAELRERNAERRAEE